MEVQRGDKIEDTNDMNDIDAALIETSAAFLGVAHKYKIPFLLRWYNPNNNTFSGASNFNEKPEGVIQALSSIQDYLATELKGQFKIVKVE